MASPSDPPAAPPLLADDEEEEEEAAAAEGVPFFPMLLPVAWSVDGWGMGDDGGCVAGLPSSVTSIKSGGCCNNIYTANPAKQKTKNLIDRSIGSRSMTH